ncbi:MAG: DUF5615 family PIN-like protein [Sandaracinaceae bacterium]|nr:DUF5615 family PIN-like protein [Sandaracinaceae bacterium]
MWPPATSEKLVELGHDALCVEDAGLAGADDEVVYEHAVAQRRVVVTENFGDFSLLLERRLAAAQPSAPVVFVREASFPRRGRLADHLARALDAWAAEHPEPYVGAYWV